MQISRRNALLGVGAAAAVAGVPAVAHADPVVAQVNRAFAYRDWINHETPDDISDEELNALCEPLNEMLNLIRLTPAISVHGIASKTQVAWIQMHPTIDTELNGPGDEFGQLAPERFIWSVLQDFERLIGGMRP